MFWPQNSRLPVAGEQECIYRRNRKRCVLLQVSLCLVGQAYYAGQLAVPCVSSAMRSNGKMKGVKIALLITCLGDVLRPSAGRATVELLRRLGHEVVFPQDQTCCGQPMYNSGFSELAKAQAQHTIRVFEEFERIVTPSGSCAAMVKVEYPHLLQGESQWHDRAEQLASRTFELADFLVNQLEVTDVGAKYEGRVAVHFACHLRMLNQTDEVDRLVSNVAGAELVPIERRDQCCGFGGSFAVRYANISGAMVDDKMACILRADADALVSTDNGCLMNIGGRLHREGQETEVLHIAELLERR